MLHNWLKREFEYQVHNNNKNSPIYGEFLFANIYVKQNTILAVKSRSQTPISIHFDTELKLLLLRIVFVLPYHNESLKHMR